MLFLFLQFMYFLFLINVKFFLAVSTFKCLLIETFFADKIYLIFTIYQMNCIMSAHYRGLFSPLLPQNQLTNLPAIESDSRVWNLSRNFLTRLFMSPNPMFNIPPYLSVLHKVNLPVYLWRVGNVTFAHIFLFPWAGCCTHKIRTKPKSNEAINLKDRNILLR